MLKFLQDCLKNKSVKKKICKRPGTTLLNGLSFIQRYDWLLIGCSVRGQYWQAFSKFGYNLHPNLKWPFGRAANHHASISMRLSQILRPHSTLAFSHARFLFLTFSEKTSVILKQINGRRKKFTVCWCELYGAVLSPWRAKWSLVCQKKPDEGEQVEEETNWGKKIVQRSCSKHLR